MNETLPQKPFSKWQVEHEQIRMTASTLHDNRTDGQKARHELHHKRQWPLFQDLFRILASQMSSDDTCIRHGQKMQQSGFTLLSTYQQSIQYYLTVVETLREAGRHSPGPTTSKPSQGTVEETKAAETRGR
jgi:hypothetical protein